MMKKKLNLFGLFFLLGSVFIACNNDEDDETDTEPTINMEYRNHMRSFVQNLSQYARGFNPDFIVIPQNGQELVCSGEDASSQVQSDYIQAIDGVGREDLLYGYENDNEPTPSEDVSYMVEYLDICEQNGIEVLVTDYCWEQSNMDYSYSQNEQKGYISYAAMDRGLNAFPSYPATPYNVNSNDIHNLSDAKNFFYILNNELFQSKESFINAIGTSDYDVIIMDLFFVDDQSFTAADIAMMKNKQNGGQRLIIAYMSIGEAENYRYYWQNDWETNPPEWLLTENPDWEGNFKVEYWNSQWQQIIYGNDDSYLKKIIDADFDGVYLDLIDAFEYFEYE